MVFALSAGAVICNTANAGIDIRFHDVKKLTDEELEKKAPSLDGAIYMYTTENTITKEQFIKYVRTTHNKL